MNVFLLSRSCGHCVHQQLVLSNDELNACVAKCVGAPCPVCGILTRKGDFDIMVTETSVDMIDKAIKLGASPWGNADRRPANFSEFYSDGGARASSGGEFTQALRAKMYRQAQKDRKEKYTAISEAFARLSAPQFGWQAYEEGNFVRAATWYERAAPVQQDPTARAVVFFYLGLSRWELSEPQKAKSAFRDSVDCSDADPTIRSIAAKKLGHVLKELGDVDGAREAFHLAMDLASPTFASSAAVDLGALEDEAGNHAKAKSLWEYAYNNASEDCTKDFAAHNLGWYWEQVGELRKARRYYQIAAKSSVEKVATRAARKLQILPSRSRRFFDRTRT